MRYGFWLMAVAWIVAAASPAAAKAWTIDYAHSTIGFTGMQGSSMFDGSFKKFQIALDLDPDHPEAGTITATIDIASASAGSAERDDALPQAEWFNTSHFPQARFETQTIRKTGDRTYEAEGTLTIKGNSRPVKLPFTLVAEGDHMRAQGRVTLIRTDFGIGAGQWSDDAFVKHAVDVTIDISAR